jgi:L-ascorbate metabolism protein UlaG (beta-lactamase superfamily)
MRWRWLGWAGVELEADGATLVIDPLGDAAAVFDAVEGAVVTHPLAVAATEHSAVAGLVTHLHRDHADAAALQRALLAGAPVLTPPESTGQGIELFGLAQADAELAAAGLSRRALEPWQREVIGPFAITALPAVDGLGDPQVSWLVEAQGARIVHLGDTMFHGGLWPIAMRGGSIDVVFAPVNGAVVRFPHRRPASDVPVVMDPEVAATAAQVLGARVAVPIHAEGYTAEQIYTPVAAPTSRFLAGAAERGVAARAPRLGEWVDIEAAA